MPCVQAAAFERVAAACVIPFKHTHAHVMRVQPFGSYANGLSLAESDIDIVITGILQPDDERGGKTHADFQRVHACIVLSYMSMRMQGLCSGCC